VSACGEGVLIAVGLLEAFALINFSVSQELSCPPASTWSLCPCLMKRG